MLYHLCAQLFWLVVRESLNSQLPFTSLPHTAAPLPWLSATYKTEGCPSTADSPPNHITAAD